MPALATVDVPASSANLGSGYDCFAAALSLKLRAELYRGDEPGIVLEAHGEGANSIGSPDDNLVVRSFRDGLKAAHGPTSGHGAWRIDVRSMVPAARGLGSSAAAIVAGLLLGIAAGRHNPEPDEVLALASKLEGHPDNVAAALYGGITLAVTDDGERPTLRRFRVPEAWIPVIFVPHTESRTTDMRDVLPLAIPHHEAAAAAARAALLATAVITSDAGLLRVAMDDRLHQPFRLPRLPGTQHLIDMAYDQGAAGACLSGAGPSVLAICDSPLTAHAVEKAWAVTPMPGMAARLRFDTAGARLETPEDRPG